MRILINTSTIVETGCTQVSVSFIYECINFPENEYYVLLSTNVARNINQGDFPSNFHFTEIKTHPLYAPKAYKERQWLRKYERELKPDCVFSVFGPSWWTPSAPHLMGYAFPYYVYPDSPFFKKMSFKERCVVYLHKIIHQLFLKRNGSFFVCETEDVSDRLSKSLHIDRSKIYTVSNTANAYFRDFKITRNSIKKENDTFNFYSLCSPKSHKNLEILNQVIPLIKKYNPQKNIFFHVTCPHEKYVHMFDSTIKEYIVNHGLLPVADCPSFVSDCDALFLPTLMECFSASYPEAMCMQKPIVTSDLPFATCVCEDAAIYFDPLSPEDIARSIVRLVNDDELYENLVVKGKLQLTKFFTPRQRAAEYLKILKIIQRMS